MTPTINPPPPSELTAWVVILCAVVGIGVTGFTVVLAIGSL